MGTRLSDEVKMTIVYSYIYNTEFIVGTEDDHPRDVVMCAVTNNSYVKFLWVATKELRKKKEGEAYYSGNKHKCIGYVSLLISESKKIARKNFYNSSVDSLLKQRGVVPESETDQIERDMYEQGIIDFGGKWNNREIWQAILNKFVEDGILGVCERYLGPLDENKRTLGEEFAEDIKRTQEEQANAEPLPVFRSEDLKALREQAADLAPVIESYNLLEGMTTPSAWTGLVASVGGVGLGIAGIIVGGLTIASGGLAIGIIGLGAALFGLIAPWKKENARQYFPEEFRARDALQAALVGEYMEDEDKDERKRRKAPRNPQNIFRKIKQEGQEDWKNYRRKWLKMPALNMRYSETESMLINLYSDIFYEDEEREVNPQKINESLYGLAKELYRQPPLPLIGYDVMLYNWQTIRSVFGIDEDSKKRDVFDLFESKVKSISADRGSEGWYSVPTKKSEEDWIVLLGKAPVANEDFLAKNPGLGIDLNEYMPSKYPVDYWGFITAKLTGIKVKDFLVEGLEVSGPSLEDWEEAHIGSMPIPPSIGKEVTSLGLTDYRTGSLISELPKLPADVIVAGGDGVRLNMSVEMNEKELADLQMPKNGEGEFPHLSIDIPIDNVSFQGQEGQGFSINAWVTLEDLRKLFEKVEPLMPEADEILEGGHAIGSRCYREMPAPQIVHRFEKGSVQIHNQSIDKAKLGNLFVSFLKNYSRK